MINQQMELGLGKSRFCRSSRRGAHSKSERARWWFQRMRQAVDQAFDWQPVAQPRPEQIWFPE
jgi:hypothetical protein